MNIFLDREPSDLSCTFGSLFIDDEFSCFTLEDVVREIRGVPVERWKVPGKTAIPAGTYKVILTISPRFKRVLPLLIDVPGFDGVRIHTGNKAEDTEGCILIGWTRENDFLGSSQKAFNALFPKLQAASSITITIRNAHGF